METINEYALLETLSDGDLAMCEFIFDVGPTQSLVEMVTVAKIQIHSDDYLPKYLVISTTGSIVGVATINPSEEEDAAILICNDMRMVDTLAKSCTRDDPRLPMDLDSAMCSLDF